MRILSFSQQWILRTFLNMDYWFHLPEPARPPSVQLWTCRGGQPGVTRPRSGRAGPAQTRRAADLSAPPRSCYAGASPTGVSRGSKPPHDKKPRGSTPRNLDISVTFFRNVFFALSNIFKIKWPKSEKNLNFGGMWVWVPMKWIRPPPPIKTSWRRPCCYVTASSHQWKISYLYITTVLKYYWMGWFLISSGNSTDASTRHVSACAPHFLPCCFGIGCTFFSLPVMCFNQPAQRHRFFAQLFGQLFRNFPENCRSRSPKVRSPGQVKWHHLRKTFQSRHGHSSGEKDLKLSGFGILPSTYNFNISDFLYRWPKARSIPWPPHYKSMGKNQTPQYLLDLFKSFRTMLN